MLAPLDPKPKRVSLTGVLADDETGTKRNEFWLSGGNVIDLQLVLVLLMAFCFFASGVFFLLRTSCPGLGAPIGTHRGPHCEGIPFMMGAPVGPNGSP